MIPLPTLITFILYFILLLAVGSYFYRKSVNIEHYLLGGRGLGAWVTALSAQASDMSGWLLMGLPGALFLAGMGECWIAVGLFIGTCLNWKFVAARLRVYTQKTNAITLPTFFANRFRDPTGLLRIVSALIILIFFTIYASSGLKAAGLLFESILNVDYHRAVLLGGLIVITYTFLGGFLAVCWTDMIQGSLMLIAIIAVPAYMYFQVGGWDAIQMSMQLKNLSISIWPGTGSLTLLGIISTMAWGLGYFGQPHILARFMGIRKVSSLKRSMTIAVIWVFISLTGAVIVGLIALGMFDDLAQGDHEKVFIFMITKYTNPWLGGILLAAILSAIMSTIDSQLLVSSSALTEDFYQKTFKRTASEKEVVFIGRLCVIIISLIALFLALDQDNTVLGIVSYAWGGFGAAFGPLVLFALFSRRTTWYSALAGMILGTAVLVLWKQLGFSDGTNLRYPEIKMYEIIPGFLTNCLTIFLINLVAPQKNPAILHEFYQIPTAIISKK